MKSKKKAIFSKDNIKMDLKEVGFDDVNWTELD
jgi:hypothetical protein